MWMLSCLFPRGFGVGMGVSVRLLLLEHELGF